jgi:hypothetical protein
MAQLQKAHLVGSMEDHLKAHVVHQCGHHTLWLLDCNPSILAQHRGKPHTVSHSHQHGTAQVGRIATPLPSCASSASTFVPDLRLNCLGPIRT